MFRVIRVPPLVVLAGRERDRLVEHRRHHIDEGHLGENAVEEFGALIDDGPEQEAAGTPAHREEPLGRGEAFRQELLGADNEVGKRVLLSLELAVVVPPAPEFLPARTCAMAKVNPRSSRLRREDWNVGSRLMPYAP